MTTDETSIERRQTGAVDALLMTGLVSTGFLLVVPPASFSAIAVMAGLAGVASISAAALRPLSISGRQRAAMALIGALLILEGVGRSLYVWPLHLLLPLMAGIAATAAAGASEDLRPIWRLRRVSAGEWVWIGIVAVLAAVAIKVWILTAKPDLAALRAMVPAWHGLALAAAGFLFAIVNAVLEEAAWRGILMRWLSSWVGQASAVLLQAVSFGLAHWNGVPSGWAGVLLAFGYGVILGWLVMRSKSLVPAIIAHVAADLVIFAMLITQ